MHAQSVLCKTPRGRKDPPSDISHHIDWPAQYRELCTKSCFVGGLFQVTRTPVYRRPPSWDPCLERKIPCDRKILPPGRSPVAVLIRNYVPQRRAILLTPFSPTLPPQPLFPLFVDSFQLHSEGRGG